MLTVGYLLEQIEHIQVETAAGPHQLTVDVQRPTGSFSIDFLGGFTSFYDRVTNIAVRLEPKGGAEHLMLANCHFDTVANSPGQKETRLCISTLCSHYSIVDFVCKAQIKIWDSSLAAINSKKSKFLLGFWLWRAVVT